MHFCPRLVWFWTKISPKKVCSLFRIPAVCWRWSRQNPLKIELSHPYTTQSSYWKMYLPKIFNEFVQLTLCICQNCLMYLFELQIWFVQIENVFVQIKKYICSNYQIRLAAESSQDCQVTHVPTQPNHAAANQNEEKDRCHIQFILLFLFKRSYYK